MCTYGVCVLFFYSQPFFFFFFQWTVFWINLYTYIYNSFLCETLELRWQTDTEYFRRFIIIIYIYIFIYLYIFLFNVRTYHLLHSQTLARSFEFFFCVYFFLIFLTILSLDFFFTIKSSGDQLIMTVVEIVKWQSDVMD